MAAARQGQLRYGRSGSSSLLFDPDEWKLDTAALNRFSD